MAELPDVADQSSPETAPPRHAMADHPGMAEPPGRHLEATALHPACRLVLRTTTPDAEVSRNVMLHADWALEDLCCESCGEYRKCSEFTNTSLSRAIRRITRSMKKEAPTARGKGGVHCKKCVMATKSSKNMVLEAIHQGNLRAVMTMTLDLKVPAEGGDRAAYSACRELRPGLSLKSMDAELYAAAAEWVADLPSPCGTSSEETDDDERNPGGQ